MPTLFPGWLGTQRTVPALRRARDLPFPAHRTPVPLVGIPWDRGASFHVFFGVRRVNLHRPRERRATANCSQFWLAGWGSAQREVADDI